MSGLVDPCHPARTAGAVEAAAVAGADAVSGPPGVVAVAAVAAAALGDVGVRHGRCSEAVRLSVFFELLGGHCCASRLSLLEARLGGEKLTSRPFS